MTHSSLHDRKTPGRVGAPSAPSRGGLEGDVRWPAPSTEELSCEFLDEPLLVVVDRPAGLDDELLVDAHGSEGTVDRPGCREGVEDPPADPGSGVG